MRRQISSYSRRSSEDSRSLASWAGVRKLSPAWPDGLVRLLRVLHLGGVDAGSVGHVGGTIELSRLLAGRVDRGLRQRHRVSAHIGDVAVLVQPLRDGHRVLGGERELARGFLLQRRGPERRVRRAPVGLALDAGDGKVRVLEPLGQGGGGRGVQVQDVGALAGTAQLADRGEVAALGHPLAVDADQVGGERGRVGDLGLAVVLGGELGLEVGVGGRAERDPFPLPVNHQPGGDRLHPPGGQLGHDLLPQHGRDLVPVQPVQHPAGLVGVHQAVVDLTRAGDGAGDRLRGDLVEDHPAGGNGRLELLEQVPGDGLALAVLVCREQQFVRVLQQALELGDLLPLVAVHDVEGLEIVVDVDAQPGPRLAAVLGRDLGRAVRHVTDVADAGLHHVTLAEVPGDGPGLGRGLDDDQLGAMTIAFTRGGTLSRGRFGLGGRAALHFRGGRRRLGLCRWCPCWHSCSSRPRIRAVTVSRYMWPHAALQLQPSTRWGVFPRVRQNKPAIFQPQVESLVTQAQ